VDLPGVSVASESPETPDVTVAPRVLGDSQRDLAYTPVTPCRVFDSRSAVLGTLSPNTPRDFLVAGDDGFAAQGGSPARIVECAMTCSISVASTGANVSGSALIQSGVKLEGTVTSGWGWLPMPLPLVASAGSSAVTQATTVSLGASLRFQFGCHVSSSADFVGDTAQGTVSWVCRRRRARFTADASEPRRWCGRRSWRG